MEESGIVSIWLGSFESREALAAYAENRFMGGGGGGGKKGAPARRCCC